MRRLTAGCVVLALIVPVLTACSAASTGSEAAPTVGTASPGPDGVQVISVTGDDHFRFNPSRIHAKPGLLRIVFSTLGGTPHDLEVRPMKVNTGIVNTGERKTIEVRLARGSYDFVCTFHIASNMVGTITVA